MDVVWGSDRPSPPCNPLLILPLKYSGEGVGGGGEGEGVGRGRGGEDKWRGGDSYTIIS